MSHKAHQSRVSKRSKLATDFGAKKLQQVSPVSGGPDLHKNKEMGYKASSKRYVGSLKSKRKSKRSKRVSRRRSRKARPLPNKAVSTHSSVVSAATNVCSYGFQTMWSAANIETYCSTIAKLDDDAADGVGVVEEMTMAAGLANVSTMCSVGGNITFKNNYNFPVKINVWKYTYKRDSTENVTSLLIKGFDEAILADNGYETSIHSWPSHASAVFKKYIKLEKVSAAELQPGQELVARHTPFNKSYKWNERVNDSTVDELKGSTGFLYRVQGCISHNSVGGAVGYAEAKADFVISRFFRWKNIIGKAEIPHVDAYTSNLTSITSPIIVDAEDPGTESTIGS